MVRLEGRSLMGSESPEAFPTDGEGPVRAVTLSPFYISKFAVTNEQFAEFVSKTAYCTEAQRFGWSFVFRNHVPEPAEMPGTRWWVRVDGADWAHPVTPTAVLEKLGTIQMIDVWIPTCDGRWLILPRYSQPAQDLQVLLEQMALSLPSQPPPRITAPVPPPAADGVAAQPCLW